MGLFCLVIFSLGMKPFADMTFSYFNCLYFHYCHLLNIASIEFFFIVRAKQDYFFFLQDISAYLKGCKFLPKLNNEIYATRNSTYKERFASLETLVLIMVS